MRSYDNDNRYQLISASGPTRDVQARTLTCLRPMDQTGDVPDSVGSHPQYDEFADEFLQHAGDNLYNAHYDRPACLGLLGDVAGRTVLDAACGPGLYAEELTARGARVIGFDPKNCTRPASSSNGCSSRAQAWTRPTSTAKPTSDWCVSRRDSSPSEPFQTRDVSEGGDRRAAPGFHRSQTVTTTMPASVKGRICASVAVESVTKVTSGGSGAQA